MPNKVDPTIASGSVTVKPSPASCVAEAKGPTVLKAFWQDNCPRCPQMKQVADQLINDGYEVQYFDLSTVNGLAEGAYYSVMATPTLLLVDGEENELAEWRGEIPSLDEVKNQCAMY